MDGHDGFARCMCSSSHFRPHCHFLDMNIFCMRSNTRTHLTYYLPAPHHLPAFHHTARIFYCFCCLCAHLVKHGMRLAFWQGDLCHAHMHGMAWHGRLWLVHAPAPASALPLKKACLGTVGARAFTTCLDKILPGWLLSTNLYSRYKTTFAAHKCYISRTCPTLFSGSLYYSLSPLNPSLSLISSP